MVSEDLIEKYFPDLDAIAIANFAKLYPIYKELNERVNLISRKDFDNFYEHHVLHSLALTKFCEFPDGSKVIDIGTGGGFPGIPLAIMYPNVQFVLCDSIAKKIRAVQEAVDVLELQNVMALNNRTETLHSKFDIAVARAVAPATELWNWMDGKWKNKPLFYLLKGGDLGEELNELLGIAPRIKIEQHAIADVFSESFFETKKVLTIRG